MGSLISIGFFQSRIEAEIAKGLLESNGIKSVIFAEDLGGWRPYPISYSYGVELKVDTKDAEEAKRILEDTAEENKNK